MLALVAAVLAASIYNRAGNRTCKAEAWYFKELLKVWLRFSVRFWLEIYGRFISVKPCSVDCILELSVSLIWVCSAEGRGGLAGTYLSRLSATVCVHSAWVCCSIWEPATSSSRVLHESPWEDRAHTYTHTHTHTHTYILYIYKYVLVESGNFRQCSR